MLYGHVPSAVAGLTPKGRLPATNNLRLAIGLPLRNQAVLDELLEQIYNPQSTNFHKFLKPDEFTARFGPTEQDYQAVIRFAEANGLTVVGKHPNRVVLDVRGGVSNIEQAFNITLRSYQHPMEARECFAPDTEPSVPANLPVVDMWGLSDYGLPRPLAHKVDPLRAAPLNYNGSGPGGAYQGSDFRNAYAPETSLAGIGQIAAVAEFDGYYATDITSYESQCGYTNVPLQNVLLDSVSGTPGYSGAANAVAEVSLDIELIIAMAPGLFKLMVYEGSSPYDVFNRIVTDNLAKQVSCSWSWSYGPTHNWGRPGTKTLDSQLRQMAAQGQTFFQASGDADAYTGSQALNTSTGPIPVDSIYVTSVGGTTLNMNGIGASWSSETVWNWGGNVGSGGGVSPNYAIPYWQTNVSMAANSGSTANRNIPDVAMTADAVHVVYNNGSSGTFGGTSCAAPLWAGFCALANQQSSAAAGTTVGFLNPALYTIATGATYTNCFHDITTGNNIGNNTPGLYYAVPNYDVATGLGTPNGTNLINALAPLAFPYFITQPGSQTVTNNSNISFSAAVAGQSPLSYRWLFNGTNLPAGGNVSGTTSNVLSITAATANNSGNYQIIATNGFGSVTSGVAVLSVGSAPAFSTQPANLTILSGGNANFSATVSGSTPLAYQWRKNGANLSDGVGVSGATTSSLTLTAVTTTSSGSYTLLVTNDFGAGTSSAATLTVVLPPAITGSLTNQTIECGGDVTFNATVSGTAPLSYQWSLDGTPVTGPATTSLSLTNVHLPNHTVTLVVANLYGSAESNVVLTVHDTLPPVVTLNGSNLVYVELGTAFTDPGATANDTCAGAVPVVANGIVNTSGVGTNTLVYIAGDGSGNTNTAMRTVVVRDTTPPTLLWSFTNLVLTADANCSAGMPDVTGTNYILATDLSGTLTISQSPTNHAPLLPGTNTVVITVEDASSNAAFSTNIVVVLDQTPPVITLNGSNPLFAELGQAITDPGAAAIDTCAGSVPVVVTGTVNTGAVGTNTLVYTADDGSGNTNTAVRTVIVLDTTPPAILWSFTNLVLTADASCGAAMLDVTGTNYILASDLSGALTVSQSPTAGAVLLMGTNLVVISVADVYGNTAYSTNTIVVQDQMPPLILSPPQSRTNLAGTDASFNVAATACTPLAYQWLFNGTVLTDQTNSTLTLVSLSTSQAGSYAVVVSASGGSTTSTVATLMVDLMVPILTLNSSANPSGYQDTLNFTAAVTPTNATGTIQFLMNGAAFDTELLIAGQATSTNLLSLPRGTNLIVAAYSGDANVLPSTTTLLQIVTNHPPVAAPVFYRRLAGSSLEIAIADLATNWTDVDGDIISLAAFSVSTNGVTLTNNAGILAYFNASDVDDQFVCIIDDGFGGTNSQIVNIALDRLVSPTPTIISIAANPVGSFTLQLTGAPDHTYILEATASFVPFGDWQPVATNTLGASGAWQFTDTQATNVLQQFYRLKLVQ
jgi:fructose-specific component phosphotransferase system IIB-like protein